MYLTECRFPIAFAKDLWTASIVLISFFVDHLTELAVNKLPVSSRRGAIAFEPLGLHIIFDTVSLHNDMPQRSV